MMNRKSQARIAFGILLATLNGCVGPIAGGPVTDALRSNSPAPESLPDVKVADVNVAMVQHTAVAQDESSQGVILTAGARPIRPAGFVPTRQEATDIEAPIVIASVASYAEGTSEMVEDDTVVARGVSELQLPRNVAPSLPVPVSLVNQDQIDKDQFDQDQLDGDQIDQDEIDTADQPSPPAGDDEVGTENADQEAIDGNDNEPLEEAETVNALLAPKSTGTNPLSVAEAVRVALSRNKGIVVLGYVPQEIGTFISTENAAFDPVVNANVRGGKLDRQLANFIESGGVIPTNEQQSDIFGSPDDNVLSITKLLRSGGTVEAGVGTNYLFQDPVGNFTFVNPAWASSINLRFTQPLLRGFGRDVTTAPLRIAQAGQSEAIHEFQAQVNLTLRNVEQAYWDWKLAIQQYEVRQAAVEQALLTLEQEKEALRLGESTTPDVEQAQDQWQRFRVDATLAKNSVRQSRIVLNQLMGIGNYEATYDFAVDVPDVEAPIEREFGEATALSRPEIAAARSRIQQIELQLRIACNNMKPELAMIFDYSVTGLENRLDDSFDTVFDNRFNDWVVGLDYRRAVGLRAEYAELRRTRLQLARARAEQEQIEFDIMTTVAAAYENVVANREALEIQRLRVDTARRQLVGRDELYEAGEGTLDQKVRAEESLVDAMLAQGAAEIALQQALVEWNYVTGQQQFVQYTGS